MSLFGFLFGNAGEEAASRADDTHGVVQWEGGTLRYDPELIPKLTQEHGTLLSLFSAIRQSHEAGDLAVMQKALNEFKGALSVHLLTENVRLYAYVKKGLAQDAKGLETMTAFWKEMQAIAKTVIEFLGKYQEATFTQEMRDAFGRDLEAIGVALTTRIRQEEERLYTLYRPSYAN